MSVLVVDDHPDVADFIAEALRDLEGMDVETVHSTEEAESRARKKAYDLFIVDLYLHGGDFSADGLVFAKWVRKKHPRAKIILMTGKSYSKIITEVVVRTGETHLLSKPIELNTLLETVHMVMEEDEEEEGEGK